MPRLPGARLSSSLLTTAAEQHGLLATSQLRDGGIDRNALRSLRRGGRLFPALIGVWSLVPAIDLDAMTMVRAARLAVGGGVACLPTAALLQNLPAPLSRDLRPHLSLPEDATRHQLSGISLHWLALAPEDVVVIDGIPVTAPPRLYLDATKKWSRGDAVALLDAALRSGKLTLAAVSELEGCGSARAKAWAALADPLSESPLETHARLLLHDAGLGAGLVSQHVVRSPSGRALARLDLAVPSVRIGVECDGHGPHQLPEALFRDRHRQDDLHAMGWRLVRVTWEDLRNHPDDVVRRVRRALAQAS